MFINFSNHPSGAWSERQVSEARLLGGEITDLAFPSVAPDMTSDDVSALADVYAERILAMNPECVMCQGEFTLAFAVIVRLINHGVRVVAACSERKTTVTSNVGGSAVKRVVFEFTGFRKYCM